MYGKLRFVLYRTDVSEKCLLSDMSMKNLGDQQIWKEQGFN